MERPPDFPPIGLRLARTARVVGQAFERALAEAGSTPSAWQVLLLVKTGQCRTQARLAEAMGITGATMTHHLNALEAEGLVRRWRDDGNRRVQRVELSDTGEALFDRLRRAALRHDRRLRSRLAEGDVEALSGILDRLEAGLRTPDGEGSVSRRRP